MDARGEFFLAKLKLEGVTPTPRWILVSVVHQRLWAYEGEKMVKEYICSTSEKPASCAWGSNGTPLGLHKIEAKIGAGEPIGTVFEQRASTGKTFEQGVEKSLITSRILWLAGVEENKNLGYTCGSHNRKIYIHGTNHEEKIGQRVSAGCVQLTNADVVQLFDWVHVGDWVLID